MSSSVKELEQTLARMGSAQERAEFIAEHDLALTAAVRREDAAKIAVALHQSQQENMNLPQFGPELQQAITIIKNTITSEQQSALDAYRDSVIAPLLPKIKRAASMLAMLADRDPKGRRTIDDFADELNELKIELESALKSSSDAVLEREEPKLRKLRACC